MHNEQAWQQTTNHAFLIAEPKVEKLQDFLTKMFENWSEIKLERPQSVRLNSMMDLYKQYCDVISKAFDAGDIEKALTPS